jgi:hypothetical protein
VFAIRDLYVLDNVVYLLLMIAMHQEMFGLRLRSILEANLAQSQSQIRRWFAHCWLPVKAVMMVLYL